MEEKPTSNPQPHVESTAESARIIVKNSTAFLAGDAVIKLLGLAFSIYVVRQLGDERLGVYRAALAYTAIFSILGDLGMTQYATREIARGRRKADDLFWDLIIIRLFLSTLATAVILITASYIPNYNNKLFGIFLACLGFFGYAVLGPVRIILSAHERLEYTTFLTTLVQLSLVISGTIILLTGYAVHGLIIANQIGIPIAAFLGVIFIRRLNLADLNLNINPTAWLPILRHSLPFAIITFTLVAAKDLDTVLIAAWRTDQEVGWYRAAYDLIFKLIFIRSAILGPLSPQMARHYGSAPERVGRSFNFAFKLLWTLTLPIAVGTTLLSVPIIDLIYGEQYANSAYVLSILIWSLPVLSLSSLCGVVTTATDQERHAAKIYTVAALINLGTNIVAIPIWGYIGAAAATILTEVVTFVFFYGLIRNEFPLQNISNAFIKPTMAALLMGGVVFWVQGFGVVLAIVVGMIIYPMVLLLLKPFTEKEIALLKETGQGLKQ